MKCEMFKYVRQIIYTPGMTPLPAAVTTLTFLVTLINDTIPAMCFSYLPKLLKSFNISEAQTGHYAGMIVSCTYIGQVFCNVMWGYFADLKGGKLALLICAMGMTATTLAFGFTKSVTWALVTRLLQGIFMGYTAVITSILSLALDDSNRSLGFSILLTGYTISFTIGPSIGGFLAFPSEQYSHVFNIDSVFARFPILLPNLIIAVCNVIIMILIIIFLPNDGKERYQNLEYQALPTCSNDDGDTGVDNGDTAIDNEDTEVNNAYTCADGLIKNGCADDTPATALSKQSEITEKQRLIAKLISRCPEKLTKAFTLFQSRDFNICLLLLPLNSLTITAVEEVFPVFAATATQYNGLALTPRQIGIILLCSSCGVLTLQITITPKIINYLGARKTLIVFQLLCSCAVLFIPTSQRLVANKTAMFVYTVLIMMVNQVIIGGTIIAINIVVNDSIAREFSGIGNSIAKTVRAIGFIIAPIAFGSIYTWSLTNVKGVSSNHAALGFPFNQYFTFFLIALAFVASALPAAFFFTSEDGRCKPK